MRIAPALISCAVLVLIAYAAADAVAGNAHFTHAVRITGFLGSDLPAEDAGLLPGDYILAVDDRAIASTDEFLAAFAHKMPGDSMLIQTQRMTRLITLGSYFAGAARPVLGVTVEDVAVASHPMAPLWSALARSLFWASLVLAVIGVSALLWQLPLLAALGVLNGLNALDLVSTRLFLALGRAEANPLGFAMMHGLGFTAAALIKLAAIGAVSAALYILARTRFASAPRWAAYGLTFAYSFVVLHNVWGLA